VPDRLELGSLAPTDAVVIVYPQTDLPVGSLAAFMRDGGRVALADDFGTGDELLDVYGIHRSQRGTGRSPHLRGNDNLPVARPAADHALTDGVSALVSNHPTVLRHHELEPLFEFDASGHALVLAGAVGEGRLVAIGDPSMLINNMLQFQDNRRFAENLVRYLGAPGAGRVLVASGDTETVGRYGEPGSGRPFHDLSTWLEELAGAPTPPAALLLGAIVVAAILLVVATTSLPRRSPYDGATMFARPPFSGGFVGRVGFFNQRPNDLIHPLMVFKFELEGEIVRRMDLNGRTLLRDVLDGLRRRGLGEAEVAEARSLLLELDELRERQDRPPSPPRVTQARFREMIAAGQRLLRRLEEHDGGTRT